MRRFFLLRSPSVGTVYVEAIAQRQVDIARVRFANLSESNGFFRRFSSLDLLFTDSIVRRRLAHSVEDGLKHRGAAKMAAQSYVVTFVYPTVVGVDRRSGEDVETNHMTIAYSFHAHPERRGEYIVRIHDVFPGQPRLQTVPDSLPMAANA